MKHLLGVLGLVTGFLAYGPLKPAQSFARAASSAPVASGPTARSESAARSSHPALSSHPDVWFRPGWWSAADGVDPRLRGSGATKPPDTPQRST